MNVLETLKAERQKLDNAIAALEGTSTTKTRNGKRGPWSAASRKKLSQALKKKWAERKKEAKKQERQAA